MLPENLIFPSPYTKTHKIANLRRLLIALQYQNVTGKKIIF